jgi:hypothetical protein
MDVYVELVDICLPDYMARKSNVAIAAWAGYTYADLANDVYKAWYDVDLPPEADPHEVEYAVQRCINRIKERAPTHAKAWSDPVYDFQPFADDSGVYAYFNITAEM